MITRPYETKDIEAGETGKKSALPDDYPQGNKYPSLWRYLKLNKNCSDGKNEWPAGYIVRVQVDIEGTPLNPWWRRRLRDAPIDNCVEWMPDDYRNGPTDWKPRPIPEPDPDGGKGKGKDKDKDKDKDK